MKKFFKAFFISIVATIATWLGATGNVVMAVGVSGSDGIHVDGDPDVPSSIATDGGAASVTGGQQTAPDLYQTDLEQAILVLDPMGTAGLTIIETGAQSRKIEDQEFEFYSVGPRVVRATVKGCVVNADRIKLTVSDAGFAGENDTIRVIGKAGYDGKDLMLIVIGSDEDSGAIVCYAKNGTTSNKFSISDTIANGTTLVRMAKSCPESKAQTSRANAYPTSEKGCVQNFMLQIEQTEFDRMTKKRVSWDFDDIVDWNMRDYKVVKELTYLFSVGGLDRHLSNKGEDNYTMTGIWWQAGRQIELGHLVFDGTTPVWEEGPDGEKAVKAASGKVVDNGKEATNTIDGGNVVNDAYYYVVEGESTPVAVPAYQKVEIDGRDLVSFNKQAFIGNGGSQVKYLIAGCNVIEAFDNIKGRQFETKDIVTEDNLIVQNFKTSFGTIKLVYDKLFDVCGMANAALMLDKQYLRKVEFLSMNTTKLALKESGQRNSHGVVMQEVNAIYLQYADAHARVWLKGRQDMYDVLVAAKYDSVSTITSNTRSSGNFPKGVDYYTPNNA